MTSSDDERATPERAAQLRKTLGLDQPLPVQYWKFLTNAVRGLMPVATIDDHNYETPGNVTQQLATTLRQITEKN